MVFSVLFSAIWSLLRELSLFEFPLLRKSQGYTLDSGLTLSRSEKKDTRSKPSAPIPPQNHSIGLSAPFQLNLKLLLRSRCRDQPWTHSKPERNAGRTNWPCPGSRVHSSKQAIYFAPWSYRENFVQAPDGALSWQANQTRTRRVFTNFQKKWIRSEQKSQSNLNLSQFAVLGRMSSKFN